MNIYVRYCKKCGRAYDRGTNYDICQECRMREIKKEDKKNGRKKENEYQ